MNLSFIKKMYLILNLVKEITYLQLKISGKNA